MAIQGLGAKPQLVPDWFVPEAPMVQGPDETNWQFFWRKFIEQPGGVPKTRPTPLDDYKHLLETTVNSTPNKREGKDKKPAATQAPATAGSMFDIDLSPAVSAVQSVSPAGNVDSLIASMFPGAKITSGQRTAAHNKAVGGAPNSQHISGTARDVVGLPPGTTPAQIKQMFAAQGLPLTEAIDEGDHFHIAWGPKGTKSVAPQATAPFQMAPVSFMDPQLAMNMIPDPTPVASVDLPNAPVLEAPQALSPYALMGKQMLDELRTAAAPVERNKSTEKWDGIQALLQGLAAGTASAGPNSSFATQLAAGGAQAIGQYRGVRADQREQDQAFAEQKRQAAIMLAKMGLDIDQNNFEIGNRNLDRADQSNERIRATNNQNTLSADQRMVQELLANAEIAAGNVRAKNQAAMARGQAGIGAVERSAQAQNAANAGQAEMDQTVLQLWQRAQAAGVANPQITNVLARAQLDPSLFKDTKDPLLQNAERTATHVASKNDSMALGTLANELVLTGAYDSILGDLDAKKVKQAIQQKNVTGAASIVAGALNAAMRDPKSRDTLLQIIDELANAGGSPSATIISRNIARGKTAQ